MSVKRIPRDIPSLNFAATVSSNTDFNLPCDGFYLCTFRCNFISSDQNFTGTCNFYIDNITRAVTEFNSDNNTPIGGLYYYPERVALVYLVAGKHRFTYFGTKFNAGARLQISLIKDSTMPVREIALSDRSKRRVWVQPKPDPILLSFVLNGSSFQELINFPQSGDYLIFLSGTSANSLSTGGFSIAANFLDNGIVKELVRSAIPSGQIKAWKHSIPLTTGLVKGIDKNITYDLVVTATHIFGASDRAYVNFLYLI